MNETLWELTGAGWKLPILVRRSDGSFYAVRLPSIPLLRRQKEAISKALSSVSTSVTDEGATFWIQPESLESIAMPSERADPEDVVEWMPVSEHEEFQVESDKDSGLDTVRAYCAWRGALISDPTIFDALFLNFARFAMERLVNERKPVDLVFAKLVPLVARRNWTQCVMRRDHEIGGALRYSTVTGDMVKRKLLDYMATGYICGVNPGTEDQTATWTIDVVLQRPFIKMAQAAERERFRMAGKHKPTYWRSVLNELRAQLPRAIEVYAHHIKQTRTPLVHLTGDYALVVQKHYAAKVDPTRRASTNRCPVVVLASAEDKPCAQINVAEARPPLSPMPDLQPIT